MIFAIFSISLKHCLGLAAISPPFYPIHIRDHLSNTNTSYLSQALISYQPFEMHTVHHAPSQCPLYQPLKMFRILPKKFRCLMIQRIIWIRFIKQENKSINNRIDIQHRLPILAQNIQTDFPLEVDVGMVNLCVTVHFGWSVGVVIGYFEFESVGCILPKSGVRCYGHLK
mmetsp:Transcript_5880/g.14726  ORF Transcript_5880/g.14726 Transcript_5880/m.14726 type:complete len:170 (-) Transcript_5880:411-920(-)